VLLIVKSATSGSVQAKATGRQFREPKFLKNLKFDEGINGLRVAKSDFKTSKSMESIVNKKNLTQSNNIQTTDSNNEPEVVIFI